jgi:hypothetical protein
MEFFYFLQEKVEVELFPFLQKKDVVAELEFQLDILVEGTPLRSF